MCLEKKNQKPCGQEVKSDTMKYQILLPCLPYLFIRTKNSGQRTAVISVVYLDQ